MKKQSIKIISLILMICALAVVFISCGGGNDDPPKPETRSITYELDGGTLENAPSEYTLGEGLDLDELIPTKENAIFFAWYFDEEFDERAVIDEDTDADVTLYARWMPAPQKIADIPNKTKTFFGNGTTFTVDLEKYIDDNGNDVTYNATSSDTSVATCTVNDGKLELAILKAGASTTVTVEAFVEEQKCVTLSFTLNTTAVAKIACVGDSLTAVRTVGGVEYIPYPSALGDLLGDGYDVLNAGKSGVGVTHHGRYGEYTVYAEAEHQNCLTFNPDVIIIFLGTNDAKGWDGCVNQYTQCTDGSKAKDVFKTKYKELVNIYLAANPDVQIYLVASPSVRQDNSLSIPKDKIDGDIHAMQLELAAELELPIIDLHSVLNPSNSTYFLEDGVHFTNEGGEYVAELILDFMKAN